jgi:ABC-type amino acid transport system permease subunit
MWDNFGQQLYNNIILNRQGMLYVKGLGNTILITIGAAILGIIIGSLVAIARCMPRKTESCGRWKKSATFTSPFSGELP